MQNYIIGITRDDHDFHTSQHNFRQTRKSTAVRPRSRALVVSHPEWSVMLTTWRILPQRLQS